MLNQKQQQLKDDIEAAKKAYHAAGQKFGELKNSCKCHVVKEDNYESASCDICDESLGWKCPNSPDGVCKYFTYDGVHVELINGDTVETPKHDYEYESDDTCLFCGHPDERK